MDEIIRQVDSLYAPHLYRAARDPYHDVFLHFCQKCATLPDCRVLEIGSREVSGVSRRPFLHTVREFVGLDIHPGPGVDVVGDAHELQHLFPPGRFDAVFSISVFEHLAFPWKVALEINHVLRPGGLCFVSTHPVWPPHELPWDFWRFPIAGLRLLFSEPTGFRTLSGCEGLPGRVHSMVDDPPTRALSNYELPLAVALVAEKVHDYDRERLRWDVPLSSVLDSAYPKREPA